MKKQSTRMLVEAGVMLALSIVLGEFVKVFEMPMGGSVTLGGMVPLFLFAIRWGGKNGMIVGAVFGMLDFLIGRFYSLHPVSIFLDYPLAYAMTGLAGFFRKSPIGNICGIITGVFGRFICHVVSGVVFYASYAPEGQSPLVYSILYNGSFLFPELVITMILSVVLARLIKMPDTERHAA